MSLLLAASVLGQQGTGASAIGFLQSAIDVANATSYTFSSQNLGTAAADRKIIVGVAARFAGNQSAVSVTVSVGGVSASEAAVSKYYVSNTQVAGLYVASVPTGTTGDIVVTFGATSLRCGIGAWRVTGISATPSSTDSDGVTSSSTMSGTVTVPTGGFMIGVSAWTGGTDPVSWSGTGVTENYDDILEAQISSSGATGTTPGSITATVTGTSGTSESTSVYAAW